MTTITIDQALKSAKALHLTPLEAQMLMLHALGRSSHERVWLLTHGHESLSATTMLLFESLAQRRIDHEPMSYLIGQKEFYGLSLKVDSRVLDPRADTETLVDWALEVLQDKTRTLTTQNLHVLDLGTGSGAIALAIKANARLSTVWALDNSKEALEVAQMNALRLGLEIHCFISHWFKSWEEADHSGLLEEKTPRNPLPQHFDLIVSNPPYIAPNDHHLNYLVHEPLNALMAQEEGLSDLRTIAQEARKHLSAGAWLIMEHGHDQSQEVRQLLLQAGYENVQSRCDLAGIERCTGAQWPKMK